MRLSDLKAFQRLGSLLRGLREEVSKLLNLPPRMLLYSLRVGLCVVNAEMGMGALERQGLQFRVVPLEGRIWYCLRVVLGGQFLYDRPGCFHFLWFSLR